MTQLDHSYIFMPRITSQHTTETLCTSVLNTALFTIAKLWRQSRCLPTEEWMEKMCHTHSEILFNYTG